MFLNPEVSVAILFPSKFPKSISEQTPNKSYLALTLSLLIDSHGQWTPLSFLYLFTHRNPWQGKENCVKAFTIMEIMEINDFRRNNLHPGNFTQLCVELEPIWRKLMSHKGWVLTGSRGLFLSLIMSEIFTGRSSHTEKGQKAYPNNLRAFFFLLHSELVWFPQKTLEQEPGTQS